MLAGCSRPPVGPQRFAVLRFENLSGDAGLDWLQAAAQRALGAALASGRLVPFPAETAHQANLEHPVQMLHGYFDRRAGKLHFEVEVEDVARRKMTLVTSAEGELIAALSGIAKRLDSAALPIPTSSDQALEAWGKGDNERALSLDSNFGPAWVDQIQKLAAAGNSGQALETADRALAQKGLQSPSDRAGIEVLTAALRHDESARVAALDRLAKLTPADPRPLLALAAAEMNQRRFADAARAYAQAATVDPNDVQSKNMLGYAEGLAGDMDAARKAFEEYGRAPEAAENALDSLGEAYFINGKFPEAEKAFLQAYQKNPAFLDGQPLRKAAYAHWLGGDLPGADGMMDRYFGSAPESKDPLLLWRKASWLYETGRKDRAIASLEQASGEVVSRQLALWKSAAAPTDLGALKSSYEQSDPLKDGLARTFYAAALVNAGQTAQAKQLIARWPLPDDDENLLASLMFPEFQRLRAQLR